MTIPISTSDRVSGETQPSTDAAALTDGLKDQLRAYAVELGLSGLRVTHPSAIGGAGDRLMQFLGDGRHGDMDWLQTAADRRRHPLALWPEARSILVAGLSYAPDEDPLANLANRSNGTISVYAQGRDYHDVLKKKLKELARLLAKLTGEDVKVFTDTAPLMEKPLAAASGLGWQGKHTNLVSRTEGSWLFLGAILTTASISPDAQEQDHCGRCQRCLDICPTAAFPAPYQLDARRCIAYLTIEHKGHIAPEFREAIGNRIFGCDDCLAVCPWNKFAHASREARFAATEATRNPPLAALLALDEATFRIHFAGTPVKRTGRDRFIRNVLIAAGNSRDPSLCEPVQALLTDPSPIVRAMAVWAFKRLAGASSVARAQQLHISGESDTYVRGEWNAEQPLEPGQ
ncbi:MAG: tRNA epoxyqueuosine(34) reductase QueG [Hyphomicrobium sp.]